MQNGGGGDLFSGPLKSGMLKGQCRMCVVTCTDMLHVHDDTRKHFALCPSVARPVGLPAHFVFELQFLCECQKAVRQHKQ